MAVAPVAAAGISKATISTAATVAGAAISAIGAIQQGQATQASLDYQAGIQRQQAARERADAADREEDFRRQQSKLMGQRRALLGGSGVVESEGSPLLTSEEFAGESELQALRIRSGGEVSATRLEQQAALNQFQGRTARTGSYYRAGSLLLTGAGRAFGR